ncbi:MAG: diaminopimelate epimerase [Myxococcota bacterium]
MKFIKSHGLGNDYLTLHICDGALSPSLVRRICHRNTGVGGDGILEPVDSAVADFGLRIWNPDGSLAEKSGNGLRIFARYLVDHRDAPPSFTVEVASGVVDCQVDEDAISVEMGRATFAPAEIPTRQRLWRSTFPIRGTELEATAVGVGNPHCVIWFPPETELDGLPWRQWGPAIENHSAFPNRTNVQFVRVSGPQALEMRIWERGAGETSASGSSSCAVAAAAVALGALSPGPITVQMPGGTLEVTVRADMTLRLRGPVAVVCEIEIASGWLG